VIYISDSYSNLNLKFLITIAAAMEICEAADAMNRAKLAFEQAINTSITTHLKKIEEDVASIKNEIKTTKGEMVKSKEFDTRMWRVETLLTAIPAIQDDVKSML